MNIPFIGFRVPSEVKGWGYITLNYIIENIVYFIGISSASIIASSKSTNPSTGSHWADKNPKDKAKGSINNAAKLRGVPNIRITKINAKKINTKVRNISPVI